MKLYILVLSLSAAAANAVVCAGAANAATRDMIASGTKLAIDDPCAREVIVQPDPSLSGQVKLQATAANPEELAQLELVSGDGVRLHVPETCWHQNGGWSFTPTLIVTLHVPPAFPVEISAGGSGGFRLGPIGGPLNVDASGSARIEADHVTALNVSMSGSGDVLVRRVDGSVETEMSGSGTLRIGAAAIQALALSMSGSGDFRVDSGTVGKLTLEGDGSGQVQLGATVGDADLTMSGSGNVAIAKLTGAMTKDVSGSATVRVGKGE